MSVYDDEAGARASPQPWQSQVVGTFFFLVDATGKKIATLLGTFDQKDANATAIITAVAEVERQQRGADGGGNVHGVSRPPDCNTDAGPVAPEAGTSLGAALGKIIAGYRDGKPKECAAALVRVVDIVEFLEWQRDHFVNAGKQRAALPEESAGLVTSVEQMAREASAADGPVLWKAAARLAALEAWKQEVSPDLDNLVAVVDVLGIGESFETPQDCVKKLVADLEAAEARVAALTWPLTMGAQVDTATFLEWVADRFVNVYGENENVDFVHSARDRAKAIRAALGRTPT